VVVVAGCPVHLLDRERKKDSHLRCGPGVMAITCGCGVVGWPWS
jgi:hypothetical protein